jgi:hypothetical protein
MKGNMNNFLQLWLAFAIVFVLKVHKYSNVQIFLLKNILELNVYR